MREPKYRFVKEYAKYRINKVNADDFLSTCKKKRMYNHINKTVKNFGWGFITVEEAMQELSKEHWEI